MDYPKPYSEPFQSYNNHDIKSIATRLKVCAGEIISQGLMMEDVPQSARDLMRNHFIHGLVRDMFRNIVVDCLAAHFEELEKKRAEVLEEIIRRTQSRYGTRLRLLESALELTHQGKKYRNALAKLEQHVTEEQYSAFVAVVRTVYARGY